MRRADNDPHGQMATTIATKTTTAVAATRKIYQASTRQVSKQREAEAEGEEGKVIARQVKSSQFGKN